ncbi:hypothetical protein VitviT2T_030520 [Vitis vinifera]|uniref:Ubiquitin-like protease family profile domain-containing protein n=1 Tax=Vitis vinifera TaxID=29760 RepID=A0ABY9DZL9_VITVI|nr:hypothetical protein VitviT2T_030520 [Vitis vinifera]
MGGICYERTLFGLQRALENRISKYQDKKKTKGEAAVEAYSLVGFPYAFQVWAYEAIPLIGLKYATRVSERYPRILNWSATSAPRSTEVENVFLEPHLTFHSLLTPTLEEQQQDYYKHVDKQGASAEMLHQSNASQDAKNDDLRHEKSSSDTAAYVAAATAAMAEETTNDAITPSIEHIDVAFFFFRKRRIENPHLFSQKFTTVDTMFWQNAQARWIKHGKKWNQFKLLENDILIDYANGLQPLYSVKWPDVDIVYVPINVRASHWVLGVVHLHRRIIYVYDSLMGINNNARLQVAIKPLAKLLPHILNAIAYYGFHGDTKVNYQEWEIEWLQDIPQQENE